jgi:hypothetical protein
MTGPGRWLGAWPGRIETPGHVKRRLLVVSVVGALTLAGSYAVSQVGPSHGPFTHDELQDMSGLPVPPVRFVQDSDGTYRELTPEELQQLDELQRLIENFPAPQNLGGGFLDPTPGANASPKAGR